MLLMFNLHKVSALLKAPPHHPRLFTACAKQLLLPFVWLNLEVLPATGALPAGHIS